MRKTIVAIVIGVLALATAACETNAPGTSPSLTPGLESAPAVSPSDMLESPSDGLESPAAS